MRVRFLTLSAGPKGLVRVGDIISVPDGEAKLLISGGYAESAEPEFKPEPEAEPKPTPKRKPRNARQEP